MFHKTFLLTVLLSLVLTLTACDFNAQRGESGGLDISTSASEADVTAAVLDILNRDTDSRISNPSVDLQNGKIVVSGDYRQDDGTTVNGSMEVLVYVENGELRVEATDASAGGFNASTAWLAKFNGDMAAAIAKFNTRAEDNLTLLEVTISDTQLTLKFNVRRQ